MKPRSVPVRISEREFDQRVQHVIDSFHQLGFTDTLAVLALVVQAILTNNPNPAEAKEVYDQFLDIAKEHVDEVPFRVVPNDYKAPIFDEDHEDCGKCNALPVCPLKKAVEFRQLRVVH